MKNYLVPHSVLVHRALGFLYLVPCALYATHSSPISPGSARLVVVVVPSTQDGQTRSGPLNWSAPHTYSPSMRIYKHQCPPPLTMVTVEAESFLSVIDLKLVLYNTFQLLYGPYISNNFHSAILLITRSRLFLLPSPPKLSTEQIDRN